ncbi:MAG TPA: phosphate ABC transporter permease subunit PstC [Gaiellaceae bacterium]
MEISRVNKRPAFKRTRGRIDRIGDSVLKTITFAASAFAVAVLGLITYELVTGSRMAFHRFGLGFLTSQVWDNVHGQFGALSLIFGTAVTAVLAILIATPLAIAIALFLTELAPKPVRSLLGALVEMLAAIPSVILGLWGILILGPFVQDRLEPFLGSTLGFIPFFQGSRSSSGILIAVLSLTIMVVPIIASVTRELFATVPPELREGALALGATRWEMVRGVLLPAARPGILAAVALGFGRAVGEAMAVTMVIGSGIGVHWSLFAYGDTLASKIAGQYQGADTNIQISSLVYLAAILLVISLAVNIGAQLLIRPIDLTPRRQRIALDRVLETEGMSGD